MWLNWDLKIENYVGLSWYALNAITCIPIKETQILHRWGRRQREDGAERYLKTLEWWGHVWRDACSHQKLEKSRKKFSYRASGGTMALPPLWLRLSDTDFDSGLQNCERINGTHFACFKPSFCWIVTETFYDFEKLFLCYLLDWGCS